MQTITLPAGQKNLEGLVLLAAGLERLTGGGKIEIREAIVIETENLPAFWAIQDMLKKDYMMKALPNHGHAAELIETILSKPMKALEDHVQRDDKLKPGQVKAKRHYKPRKKAKASPVLPGKKKYRPQVLYEIMDGPKTGQKYRGPSIGLMLKAGNLAPGTRLSHAERGKLIVVTNGQGTFTLQAVPA